MESILIPANEKAREMLKKLQALAERGIDGEKLVAQRKLARLKARFDFNAPEPAETPDLFQGSFKPARKAIVIHSFGLDDVDIANSVKWAIESVSKIQCIHRGADLLAEAAPVTAKQLKGIAAHIARSFRALLDEFDMIDGVNVSDRRVFVRGLYDGMMNEERKAGQRLPSLVVPTKTSKGRKPSSPHVTGLHVHPYTLAFSLGKQIRFSAPLEQIVAEFQAVTRKYMSQPGTAPECQIHSDNPTTANASSPRQAPTIRL